SFPGGLPVTEENARHFSELWGFEVPSATGLTTAEMLDAAKAGALDVLFQCGGNLAEVLPDPGYAKEALESIPLRVHMDIARSIPSYALIRQLEREGDQFQYGGPHLCWGWNFPTPDGKAHFSLTEAIGREVPDGMFVVTTRRGRQFNSMVQAERDDHTGA